MDEAESVISGAPDWGHVRIGGKPRLLLPRTLHHLLDPFEPLGNRGSADRRADCREQADPHQETRRHHPTPLNFERQDYRFGG